MKIVFTKLPSESARAVSTASEEVPFMKTKIQSSTAWKIAALIIGLAVPGAASAAPQWTVRTTNTTNNLNAVAVNRDSAGTAIAVGQWGIYHVSHDSGASWSTPAYAGSAELYGITWTSGNSFVAVGGGGVCARTASNGASWITGATDPLGQYTDTLYAVCHRGGTTVAVGNNGCIKTSSDAGVSWTLRSSGTTKHLRGVAAGPTYFVAVGDDGTVCRSTNGVTWSVFTVPPYQSAYSENNDFLAVTWAGSQFAATGGTASVFGQWTSPDGETWTYTSGKDSRHAVAWTGTHIIAGGISFAWWNPSLPASSWKTMSRPTSNQIHGLAVTTGGVIIAVSWSGGIATTSTNLPDPISLNLSANPGAGGYVYGGGSGFFPGDEVAASAYQASGYTFTNWTEGGTVVSTESIYTFVLNADRTLVANFAPTTPTRVIELSGNLAFGNVTVGTTATRTLTIRNTGNTALEVTGITCPAGFTGPWSGTINAGGSRDVTVTFNPTAAQPYSGNITVNSNATNTTANPNANKIAASGTGVAAPTRIIALTGPLTFGNVGVGSTGQKTLIIKNTGTGPLTVTGISYPAGFSGDWSGSIAPGGTQNVPVTFTPAAAQAYSGTVTVNSDKTSGTETIAASGTGIAPTRILGLTGPLTFGNVSLGSTGQRNLTIKNTGNSALTVSGISYPAGFSGAWSGVIAPGGSQVVTVTFTPDAAQAYSGTVTVNSDKSTGIGAIAASGTGIAPTRIIGLTGPLAFGNVSVGATSQKKLTIRNTGNSALTVTGISYPAGFSGDWSGSIAPGGTQVVVVTFTPLASQAYSGNVTVNSNPTSGITTIAASGNGLLPEIAVEQPAGTGLTDGAGTVTLAATTVGFKSAAAAFVIKNTGTGPLTLTGASIAGAHPGDFAATLPRFPLILAPKASAMLPVVFSPTVAGARSAVLQINSNDGDENPFDINLAGNSAAMDYHFAVGETVDFALPADITGAGTVTGVTGLPPGLKQASGRITGIPTTAGAYAVKITVKAANGATQTFTRSIVIDAMQAWAVGNFFALVEAPAAPAATALGLGGHLKFTSTSAGTFSGTLVLGSKSYSFRGQIEGAMEAGRGSAPLAAMATIVTNVCNPGQNIVVDLGIEPGGVSGNVACGGSQVAVNDGWKQVWDAAKNPAFGCKDRTLNVAMDNADNLSGPQGDGFAIIKLTKAGLATWTVSLADGKKLTGAFPAGPQGQVPFYAPITYPGAGAITSLLATEPSGDFYKVSDAPRPNGRWMKIETPAANTTDRSYRAGFDLDLDIFGAEHRAPATGQLLFGNPASPLALVFGLADGGIDSSVQLGGTDPVGLDAQLQAANKLVVTDADLPAAAKFTPTFAAATGLLSGTIPLSDTVADKKIPRPAAFSGLYIPDLATPGASTIAGFFTLPQLPAPGGNSATTPIQSGPIGILRPSGP
jgi:hypothetical protein